MSSDMKWPWDKFGYRVEPPPREQNPRAILRLLGLPETQHASVHFYESMGRAVVVIEQDANDSQVSPDQIRTASRESGWDVDMYAPDDFAKLQQGAATQFASIDGVTPALAQFLIDRGYFGYDDLSVIDPEVLVAVGGFDCATAERIIERAEAKCLESQSDT